MGKIGCSTGWHIPYSIASAFWRLCVREENIKVRNKREREYEMRNKGSWVFLVVSKVLRRQGSEAMKYFLSPTSWHSLTVSKTTFCTPAMHKPNSKTTRTADFTPVLFFVFQRLFYFNWLQVKVAFKP